MIYQLLYISTAVRPFSENELETLLLFARKKNHQMNITGMLIYHGGGFIQILEGQKQDVYKLLDSIRNDKRHFGLTVVSEHPVADRAFPQWDMAFKYLDISDMADYPAIEVLLDEANDEVMESDVISAFLKLAMSE